MWFNGVEVEQETSAPPPKKNPGSAPEESKRKERDKTSGSFGPKNLEILLSVHGQTSQANKLHLDQKAVKCDQQTALHMVSRP